MANLLAVLEVKRRKIHWNWATQRASVEKFKDNNLAKVSFLKLLTKENLFGCFHYLELSILKMESYSNDFRIIFLAKKHCDCNQIRSTRITEIVNALNQFNL